MTHQMNVDVSPECNMALTRIFDAPAHKNFIKLDKLLPALRG